MIRVRYRDLAPGVYGKAERHGRETVIYLLPGLTRAQRGAALRRLRQEARRGCGPALPAGRLALALTADRAWSGCRLVIAIVRLHPVASLVPALLVLGLMAVFLAASVPAAVRPMGRLGVPGGASHCPPLADCNHRLCS